MCAATCITMRFTYTKRRFWAETSFRRCRCPCLRSPVVSDRRPRRRDVVVGKNGSVELPAGDYGDLTLGKASNIRFTGGVYNVRSIHAEKECEFFFEAPAVIRVAERIYTKKNVYVGAAGGAGVAPCDIAFHVAGVNGDNGGLDEEPKAVEIGRDSEILTNVYVPNGTFKVQNGTIAQGAFIARDMDVGNGCQISLASGFVPPNNAPTAGDDAITVLLGKTFDSSAEGVNLLDNDADPNAGDLLVATETPVTPPSFGDIALNADGSFIYTHTGASTQPDSIVYEVCDNGNPVLCAEAEDSPGMGPGDSPHVRAESGGDRCRGSGGG